MTGEQRQYRNPRQLTLWLRGLLIASLAIHVLSVIVASMQLYVNILIGSGRIPSWTLLVIATESMVLRRGAVLAIFTLVVIGTMALWLVWLHRINANVHALNSRSLQFTPGWAVGWHFVPIANLWKPYQAMSEIWRASKNPLGWRLDSASSLLRWWWFTWLAFWIAGSVRLRLLGSLSGHDGAVIGWQMTIAGSFLGAVSTALAIVVVGQIGAFQEHAAERSLSAVFA